MNIALITGSAGLIGSEAVAYFIQQGFQVVGIDNDMRSKFFGTEASTEPLRDRLIAQHKPYVHHDVDIRSQGQLQNIFSKYNKDIAVIIHTAAQPSHDWAAKEPLTDFSINATGTLNLLELARQFCPQAVFLFTSTNKVYGDLPNELPLVELETRWDLPKEHAQYQGIDESMRIDQSLHSLFGASKLAADILVQEYGRYFGMKTVCFRAGCLTGPHHRGAEAHGFLAYLMKCCLTGQGYTIYGYKGKQVRDNIHSYDFVTALYTAYKNPKVAGVYNLGGGRERSCSILEAISLCEKISGKRLKYKVVEEYRTGDHQWYISSLDKFKSDYPQWKQEYCLEETLREIYNELKSSP